MLARCSDSLAAVILARCCGVGAFLSLPQAAMSKEVDPRIHFALVCGAKSCPPIKTYSAENVQTALTGATSAFLNGGGLIIDDEAAEIRPSKILQWYRVDFGRDNDEMLLWVSSFVDDELRARLDKATSLKYKVVFQNYDWSPNSK